MIRTVLVRFSRVMSSFSPRVLLTSAVRERCLANMKEQPEIMLEGKPTTFASVLVPLCVVDNEVHILYTKRSMNLKNHSGQVSFPGGMMDAGETEIETALRETEEEVGVPPQDVDVWGQMSPFQGRNREVLITPVVGQILNFSMDKLVPSVNEVDEIFTVPMSALCDPQNHAHLKFKFPLPCFIYGKHKIWGITGLITHMFLQCLISDENYFDKVRFMQKAFTIDELMPSKL